MFKGVKDDEISFVYDVKKEEYLNGCPLPNKHIINKYKYKLQLIKVTHATCPRAGFNCAQPDCLDCMCKDSFKNSNDIVHSFCDHGKRCKYDRGVGNTTCFNHHNLRHHLQIEFWIDDYFNIYIPCIKTYLVINYLKYPIYTFFNNYYKCKGYNPPTSTIIVYNIYCNEDIIEYESMAYFHHDGQPTDVRFTGDNTKKTFSSSVDTRNAYKKKYQDLMTFYNYNEKQSSCEFYKIMAEHLSLLKPIKAVPLPKKEPVIEVVSNIVSTEATVPLPKKEPVIEVVSNIVSTEATVTYNYTVKVIRRLMIIVLVMAILLNNLCMYRNTIIQKDECKSLTI